MADRRFRIGEWEVDPLRARLTSGDTERFVEPKGMDVLARLAVADGEVVSKQDLLDSVWSGAYVTESVLTRAVSLLRGALGDSSSAPTFIETVPRRGYRLRVPDVWSAEVDDPRISIAVLPLEDLSPALASYFADGLTDLLIGELARIRALRVTSRTSVVAVRRAGRRLPEVAHELGVRWIVEGSVQRDGDEVLVSIQLIEASSDTHRFAETYRRRASQLLVLQEELARSIATQIERGLTSTGPVTARDAPPGVIDAFLRGRDYWNLRSKEGLERAIDCYRQVLRLQPDHVPALCGIANCWVVLSLYGFVPAADGGRNLREAVERALTLDPGHPDGLRAESGLKLFFDWDFPGAKAAASAAVRGSPSDPVARLALANAHALLGEHDEGIGEVREARRIDPLDPGMSMNMADHLAWSGRTEAAIQQYEDTITLAPSFPRVYQRLAQAHREAGDVTQAGAAIDRAVERIGAEAPFAADRALNGALQGDPRAALARIDTPDEPGVHPFTTKLALMVAVGDLDRCFELMTTADRGPWMVGVLLDSDYQALRADERLRTLLSEPPAPQPRET